MGEGIPRRLEDGGKEDEFENVRWIGDAYEIRDKKELEPKEREIREKLHFLKDFKLRIEKELINLDLHHVRSSADRDILELNLRKTDQDIEISQKELEGILDKRKALIDKTIELQERMEEGTEV